MNEKDVKKIFNKVSVGHEKKGQEQGMRQESGGRIKQIDLNGELNGCSDNFGTPYTPSKFILHYFLCPIIIMSEVLFSVPQICFVQETHYTQAVFNK